ncbi:MAG: response regulator [Pseudomonadota bacterium]
MKILVLEDNEDNATLIEKSLRDYEVCNAQTLQEAREMIDGEHFDLFLIDVNLPDGSGFDFCSELSMTPKI